MGSIWEEILTYKKQISTYKGHSEGDTETMLNVLIKIAFDRSLDSDCLRKDVGVNLSEEHQWCAFNTNPQIQCPRESYRTLSCPQGTGGSKPAVRAQQRLAKATELRKRHFQHGCHISITLKVFSHSHQWKQLSHCSLTPLTQDLEWELCAVLNSARRTTVLTLLPLSHEALHCNSYQIPNYPPKNQDKRLLPWSRPDSILTLTVLFCQIMQQNRQGCSSAAQNSGVGQTAGTHCSPAPARLLQSSVLSWSWRGWHKHCSV